LTMYICSRSLEGTLRSSFRKAETCWNTVENWSKAWPNLKPSPGLGSFKTNSIATQADFRHRCVCLQGFSNGLSAEKRLTHCRMEKESTVSSWSCVHCQKPSRPWDKEVNRKCPPNLNSRFVRCQNPMFSVLSNVVSINFIQFYPILSLIYPNLIGIYSILHGGTHSIYQNLSGI
jgi:hypothetical protein